MRRTVSFVLAVLAVWLALGVAGASGAPTFGALVDAALARTEVAQQLAGATEPTQVLLVAGFAVGLGLGLLHGVLLVARFRRAES